MAGLGVVVGNPSPRPTLGARQPNQGLTARQITTPLSGVDVDSIQKADLVITMTNGATYSLSVDVPIVDMQYDQEVNTVKAWGSHSPVGSIPGHVRVDARIQGYVSKGTGVYEEPAIPRIPKFASPEDAQAWLDKNTSTA